MGKKKLIIFLSTLENGGTERQASLLVPFLVNLYSVTLVSYHKSLDQYDVGSLKINVKVLSKFRSRRLNKVLVLFFLLSCLFKRNVTFLFLCETFHPYLKIVDFRKSLRRRSIFSIRKSLDRVTLDYTDLTQYRHVHVQTNFVKEDLLNKGIKSSVIRNMHLVPRENNPDISESRVFIVVGRHDEDKGVFELCKFLVRNKYKINNAVIHVWGKGVDTKKIQELIRVNHPVPVVYCGVYTDLESVMNGCVGLISNSYSEGFPNVLDEAVIRGIPIIYRREEKASAELLTDYTNSYPFNSCEDIIDIIQNKSLSRCKSTPIDKIVKVNKELSRKWVRLLHS